MPSGLSTDRLAVTGRFAPQSVHTETLARYWPPAKLGLTLVGIGIWIFYLWMHRNAPAIDAQAYFLATGDLYGGAVGDRDAYLYSPAFAQVIEPLRWLGWDAFKHVWRIAETTILVLLTGPLSGPAAFSVAAPLETRVGNVHLFMAGAVAIGFRFPAAWSLILLTKVTPGIGLLWFAVRREWRQLGIALGATAAIALASFVYAPGLWFDWVGALAASSTESVPGKSLVVDVSLLVRLPIAAALIAWGARRNARSVVPIAVVLALPAVWVTGLAVLAAVPFLVRRD